MAKGWHRMSLSEREQHQRARDARFRVRVFRCRYCPVKVDERTREGHLSRCTEATKQGVTFARGMPVDEHYDEVKDS